MSREMHLCERVTDMGPIILPDLYIKLCIYCLEMVLFKCKIKGKKLFFFYLNEVLVTSRSAHGICLR